MVEIARDLVFLDLALAAKVHSLVSGDADLLALRVHIRARDRLLCDSYAMAEQPRTIDRSRLGEGPLTSLTPEEIIALDKALRGVMGLV